MYVCMCVCVCPAETWKTCKRKFENMRAVVNWKRSTWCLHSRGVSTVGLEPTQSCLQWILSPPP